MILSWHGYLLSGSGSNIYNLNTARAWAAAGHQVVMMCQDRHVAGLDFVRGEGDFNQSNDEYTLVVSDEHGFPKGFAIVVRPNIGDILPVYVYDEYEGFTAKRFVDLNDEELDRYVSANVDALVTAIEIHNPDAILVGHEVMGPYIAKLACERTGRRFTAKLHGSALEYAVKVQDRYLHYATEGLNAAAAVVGGSHYMIEEASRVVPGWRDKAVVVNPGCDVGLFKPQPRKPGSKVAFVGKLIASKGVHNLIGAAGLTRSPNLSVDIIGYGGFEQGLRDLALAMSKGDLDGARAIAAEGENGRLDALAGVLDDPPPGYEKRSAEVPIRFLGRLEHGPLSEVLPSFDVLAVPSVVSEAFGMVAAEAAACAVLPVVPAHSGIGEVAAALEEGLGKPGLLTYPPDDPIRGLAERIDNLLSIDPAERMSMGEVVADFARRHWSWEHVANNLLEIASNPSPRSALD